MAEGARARRCAVHDVYRTDEQTAVLTDTEVVVVSPLAGAVLDLLDEGWADVAGVVAGVVAAYGPPPGGDAAAGVAGLLEELAGRGLVEVDQPDPT